MVIEQRYAIYTILNSVGNKGDAHVQYGFLRLPLRSDGKPIDKIYRYSRNKGAHDFLHNVFGTKIPYTFDT